MVLEIEPKTLHMLSMCVCVFVHAHAGSHMFVHGCRYTHATGHMRRLEDKHRSTLGFYLV